MNNKQLTYGFALKFQVIALIAILICGVVFLGCSEGEEIVKGAITTSGDTPPPPVGTGDENKPPPPAGNENQPPPPAGTGDENKPPPPAG